MKITNHIEGCGKIMNTNHGKLICGEAEIFEEGKIRKLLCLECQLKVKNEKS